VTRPVTAAEENLVTHMTWVQARLPGGRVELDDELVVSDSGLSSDTFNFVCRARLSEGSLGGRIRGAIERFASVQRPFSWWVGPTDEPAGIGAALMEQGFEPAESELAMQADLDALEPCDLSPRGLRIERATTPAQVAEFARINAANWNPPDPMVTRFYELAAPILLAPNSPLRLYLGYLGEEAVATAELTVCDGAVGLYNISTLVRHRRKGFGSALTLRPLLDARAAGHAIAVLQASADGQGVYARLGFREVGQYTEYQLPRKDSRPQTFS
jgi:hypothetical protein